MTPARIAELRRYSAEVYVPFLVECLNEIERLTVAIALERARCVAIVERRAQECGHVACVLTRIRDDIREGK